MVDVQLEGDHAVFQVEGFDNIWALRSRLEIPLTHIKQVEADPQMTIARLERPSPIIRPRS
jgi:hypothetical protein